MLLHLQKHDFVSIIVKLGQRSVMDITQDSGSCDGGSIPSVDVQRNSTSIGAFFIVKMSTKNVRRLTWELKVVIG